MSHPPGSDSIAEQFPPTSFGAWLKRQRRLRDLTQEELAQRAGCARVTIRKFEADEMRPSKQLAELLAQALEIPAEERAAFVQFARGAQTADVPAAAAHPVPHPADPRPTNNLPLQPTSFIGREREMVEVQRLLATTHLLTLTGSGGTGKTRLALQVAAELLDTYRDGVWLVELAPLTDPTLVVTSIASVVGVLQEPGRPLVATLLDWLHDKHLLLILDNCEHLIDACAQIADAVVHRSRETRILATSREALGIAGETAYRVPSLQIPDSSEHYAISELSTLESMRLFIERATFALPTFALTDANAPAVAQICYRLDGIPLAIELAAARVKALRVEQIAERLDDRFRLLTGGSRTALPRQQTLRGTIDWSHSLLLEPERVLMRRLSVFAGGWTLAATDEVCVGDGIESQAVLDLLTHLVDKSLVLLDEQAAEPRYRMLETVRQYARERLLDAGESQRLRDQHLTFFLKLAERTEPMLMLAQRAEWIPRLEADNDNLRAALEWACERHLETACLLAWRLHWFWYFGDHYNEARTWFERLLGPGESAANTTGMALALLGAGLFSGCVLALDDARDLLEKSITLWHVLDDRAKLAEALLWLCWVKTHQGDSEGACAIFEANESTIRQSADPVILGAALTWWGLAVATARGDYDAARVLHEQSLAVGRKWTDPFLLGLTYSNFGKWATQQGDYASARQYLLQALTWQRQMGARMGIALTLGQVADVAYLQSDFAQARIFYDEALAMLKARGRESQYAHIATGLGYLLVQQGELEPAATILAKSLEILCKGQFQLDMACCLAGHADLRLAQGRAEQAVWLLATEALYSHSHNTFIPIDRIRYERSVAAARAQLDEATFNAAWEAGRALTLEQAIALAQNPD